MKASVVEHTVWVIDTLMLTMHFVCSRRIGVFVAEMLYYLRYSGTYVRLACWTGYLRQGGFKSVQFFDGPEGLARVIRFINLSRSSVQNSLIAPLTNR